MHDIDWLKPVAEQGLVFSILVGFIVASYLGKIRWQREFKELAAINQRLTEVVAANSKATSEAVEKAAQASERLEIAIDAWKEAQTSLAAIEERRRK